MHAIQSSPESDLARRRRILVCSHSASVAAILRHGLDDTFVVATADFGAPFLGTVRSFRPDVAVVDLATGHDAASVMIAILKDVVPRTRIVAVSTCSSLADGAVLEQGIYFYAPDIGDARLLEIVAAAARARDRDGMMWQPGGVDRARR